MSGSITNASRITRTSVAQVPAAVNLVTGRPAYAILKPFAFNIAKAVRDAILSFASAAARTIEAVLQRLMPVLIGFLANLIGLGKTGDFARDVLRELV